MSERVVFCWSGGKDSALALYRMLRDERYEVVSLLTTCNEEPRRVAAHGVRLELVALQAASLGLPLDVMALSTGTSNDEYLAKMSACVAPRREQGASAMVFGDIFLEDLKRWREDQLSCLGMSAVFPLWKQDTRELVHEFISLGFEAIVCCVADTWLGKNDVGRLVDPDFLKALPPAVDPCGENGEFHSFAFGGPLFERRIPFRIGEKVHGDGFWFCDLLPPA